MHPILSRECSTPASLMSQQPRHEKASHADVKHATLASQDVNVIAPLPHHCHPLFLRMSFRTAPKKSSSFRTGPRKRFVIPNQTKKKVCHSEPSRRRGEEPAVSSRDHKPLPLQNDSRFLARFQRASE